MNSRDLTPDQAANLERIRALDPDTIRAWKKQIGGRMPTCVRLVSVAEGQRELLESEWEAYECRLNEIHAMTGLEREMHGAEIERLESELDRVEFELGKPDGPPRRWSGMA
jgi:hypothetical protein